MNQKMKKYSVKILILILAVFTTLGSMAQKEDKRVLLSIGDEDVIVSEFLNVYQKNNVDTDLADKKSMKEYLELYINFRLKVKEAHDLGMDTVTSFVQELAGYRNQLAEPYFNDQEVTDELLKEAYDRLLFDVRASHILLKMDENALPSDTLEVYNDIMDVRARLLAGEDFATVAAEVSSDPSAADREAQGQAPARKGNGGDLGYFTVFDMVYPFESGAFNTEVGEISMPVRTSYGYHLIKVISAMLWEKLLLHIYTFQCQRMPQLRIRPEGKMRSTDCISGYLMAKTMKNWYKPILMIKDQKTKEACCLASDQIAWFPNLSLLYLNYRIPVISLNHCSPVLDGIY